MFRKGLLLAWLLAMAAVAPAQKRQVMLDRVVAVVGGSSILQSEVDEYAAQLTAQRRQEGYTSDRDPLNEALEDLLMQKLLYNQGVIDSVEISALDIQQRVEQHLQGMIEQEGSIAELEARHHMAVFNIREMLRQRYEERAYAEGMQHKIISRVTIVPGEVERFYKRTDRDSLPTIPEQYVYAQITKFPKSMKLAKQRAKERLLEMRERIITGQTRFDVMARMYSVDGSAITGGEMDPQPLEGFVQPFADALGELRPGQISEVVETQFGFHLIQLIDKKGRLYHCRHILIRPDYTYEEEAEPTHILDSLATKIRQDSITFEKAALLYSDDVNSKMNGGIVSNADILERAGVFDAKYTQTKFLREDFGSPGLRQEPRRLQCDSQTPGRRDFGRLPHRGHDGQQALEDRQARAGDSPAQSLAQRGLHPAGADGSRGQAGAGVPGVAQPQDRRHVRLYFARIPRRRIREQTLAETGKIRCAGCSRH